MSNVPEENMKIRILKPEDAEIYRRIRSEALKQHPEAFSSSFEEEKAFSLEQFRGRLNEDYAYTFGAFFGEELAGVVTLILERKAKLKHRANIAAMYVYPEKRRGGIGKELMLKAINMAKGIEEIEQIYLTVTSNNKHANKLYDSLGFETYGVEKRALKLEGVYFDDELKVLYI